MYISLILNDENSPNGVIRNSMAPTEDINTGTLKLFILLYPKN